MSLLMKESEERSSNIDEQKARIRQRYKGIDPEELEVIPALPPEDIFKTEKKLRVAVYARVSTDDPRQTSSYELQKNHYQDVVNKNPNWMLVEIYADEGISGTSLQHRDVEYVQILVNPIEKKLAVRPCREEEKDSFRWCSSGKKRSPKQITCRIFFAKVISLMDWNPNYRYKILGKLIRSGNEILFIFDLTSPEIFPRTLKDNGTVTTARTPSYPEEWKNQFGIPVEEHQKSMQVNIFEGYAVFDIQEKKKATDKSIEKAKEPSTAESEEKSYEQQTLFPSTNMY